MGIHRWAAPGRQVALLTLATVCTFLATAAFSPASRLSAAERKPMTRTIGEDGFHTAGGERFWSRPLYGPNRRTFVTTGELPHAALVWFHPQKSAFVRCGHFLPGVVSPRGAKWLYQAEEVTATYDPGMMRLAVKDPAFDGQLRLEVVPLAPGDGYVVRVTSTAAVELAFAFGGFLCLPDKDAYQGNREFPGGMVAELYGDSDYSTPGEGVSLATLRSILDTGGKPLGEGLKVALLADRKTQTSLHQPRTGISLSELLEQAPGAGSVQVHRVALEAGKPLCLVIALPPQDKVETELRKLKGGLAETFDRCKRRVDQISRRISLATPDTLVDLGARSLSVSMDGLWLPPVFMHGPIRWGFPGLAGWRMAYGGDVCGTYDRVASHCKHFGDHRGQGGLDRKPRADPKTALTRQAGDSLRHSQGFIGSPYNMTEMWLSFIDHHYRWTGDREFLRTTWPAIRDAVAFQKRVFDMDGDSLYENYANTYITDAHWHNGGNCTQASAYTYRGNLLAAEAARVVGQPPEPYLAEAARIRQAMNRVLWIKDKGVYAEWKDTLGEKLLHPEPELGSIYLPIDCGVADEFQAYQMLRFTEWGLPNYSFEERGPQPFDGHYRPGSTYAFPQPMQAREVKSSNWRPMLVVVYECSPGEQMDTARAYYKLGLGDRAFPLIKAVLRCMVNLTAPGGLVIRDRNTDPPSRSWGNGDVDHCDTLGPSLQCLAEGLFGIHPQMARDLVEIQPGFPSDWDHARIELRDISYTFRRQGRTDSFSVTTSRPTVKRLRLALRGDGVAVKVDGQAVAQPRVVPGICHPFVEIEAPKGAAAEFVVTHGAASLPSLEHAPVAARGTPLNVACRGGSIVELKDPQAIFADARVDAGRFSATVAGSPGHHTAFLRVKGKAVEFWQPVDVEIRQPLEIVDAELSDDAKTLRLALRNNGGQAREVQGAVRCAGKTAPVKVRIPPGAKSPAISLALSDTSRLVPGLNPLTLSVDGKAVFETRLECWDLLRRSLERKPGLAFQPVDISPHFNDDLALVHAHEYVSPRSPYCSLAIGIHLFREWCSCHSKPCGELDLKILKDAAAKNNGLLTTEPGIPFRMAAEGKNIVFVSQWDNFPKQVTIPVKRPAGHAYLLMASVTNPMQSGLVNGRVVFHLAGGHEETLELVNPRNLSWCVTHYPNRYGPLGLVQPAVRLGEHVYATLYSVPLPERAMVESVSVEAVCNESVIGLMGLTLLGDR